MLLYTYDGAPNPRRVGLFLGYKGIQLASRQIDLRDGQQFSSEYASVNPRCTVPALQLDDGTVLCDAIAICWYLEAAIRTNRCLAPTCCRRRRC
jgi:glutathione S-transferase